MGHEHQLYHNNCPQVLSNTQEIHASLVLIFFFFFFFLGRVGAEFALDDFALGVECFRTRHAQKVPETANIQGIPKASSPRGNPFG